jgi:hypothetical protein
VRIAGTDRPIPGMEGYAKIASRISIHPELGIYRRFAALNARNLLYLQAELHGLEQELDEITREDAAAEGDRKLYSRDWHTLATCADNDRRQWEIMSRIREKLKEYSESASSLPMSSQRIKAHQTRSWSSKQSSQMGLKHLDSTISRRLGPVCATMHCQTIFSGEIA